MTVAALCEKHNVELVAIGNGTASRETERFYLDVQKQIPKVTAQKVIVSEAGASVYSASELAAQEFPDLDVSLRGAESIARRLQDPLAELVKIDPQSLGVGQYQLDVSQTQLARKLDAVVEDCVNAVGVDLNTASVPLLTRVAGLTRMMAQNIVAWRDENGQFQNRQQLLKVSAELVKIDPKSIGVGQYQHYVSHTQLARKLDAVVEDCVNAVGVDLNTASVPLLTRVAGLTRMMAQNIVAWRDENGQFQNRQQL